MTDEPQMVDIPAQPIAIIRLTIPRAEIRSALPAARRELMAEVAAQGVETVGPWFTHHLRLDPEVFDFEIGVPVAAPVRAAGRIEPSERPAARLARGVHRGGFEGLNAAWEALDDWIVAQGCVPAVDLWEVYFDGPPDNPDPTTWRTELLRAALR